MLLSQGTVNLLATQKPKTMRTIATLFAMFLFIAFVDAQSYVKPKVIVTTDMGADPDDEQSMVRFLVQSNEFDVLGIITATGCWRTSQSTSNMNYYINPLLDAYESAYNNLKVHSPDYPTPAYLRSVSVLGNTAYGMAGVGSGKDSPGSIMIIAAVDAATPENPVGVQSWGGSNNLAQALWRVRNDRSQAELDEFISKVYCYDILGQDDAGAWIAVTFPDLLYIRATNVYSWQRSRTDSWWANNVQNHGALGSVYPNGKYAMEGDTPAFLYAVGRGLNDPADPKQRGWGGQFLTKKANIASMSQVHNISNENQWGTFYMYGNSLGPQEFRQAIENDFQARMDWSISSNFSSANHHPVVTLNGDETEDILKIYVNPGQNVQLSAVGTTDPDNNSLSYSWSYYQSDGTYGSSISISGSSSQTASVTVPSNAQDKEMHFVVAVQDNGSPSLTSYRRAILVAGDNPDLGPLVDITTPSSGSTFEIGDNVSIEATAVPQKGTVTGVEFTVDGTTIGTDNSAPYTATYSNATGGSHLIRAIATDSDGDDGSDAVSIQVNIPQSPYGGTAHVIPGTIEFEEFDVCGNGCAYYDDSPGTSVPNAPNFRFGEDVDIENCTDDGGGYNLGYVTAGEWLEYTVDVQSSGDYDIELRVAVDGTGRTISLTMDGNTIASNVSIPNTGGWQEWQTITINDVALNAGEQILRVTMGSTDYVNLNNVTFISTTTGNQPPMANAGTDQTVIDDDGNGSETTSFNGAASSDPDGSIVSYAWSENGTQLATGVNPSFSLAVGNHTITLTVTDNDGASDTDQINVSILPQQSNRLRVMMSTDFPDASQYINNSDPDDVQSMVRFLLHSNEFDVEGLIASAATNSFVADKDNIHYMVDLYDQVDENLRVHDQNFPTADYLHSVTYQGMGNEGPISIQWNCSNGHWSDIIGSGRDSEASEAIIAAVDKPDPRPIYIGVWGGAREIAQAIWKVQNTRTPAEADAFISKLRVFLIHCQDATTPWLMDVPNLFVVWSRTTYQGMFGADNQSWVQTNIKNNHGPLCAAYPDYDYQGNPAGVREGDSPSFMWLLSANRGINNPEDPTQPSWGGYYNPIPGETNKYGGPDYQGPTSSIRQWYDDFQAEFAERADWCIASTPTPVESVTLTPATASVFVGATSQLTEVLLPTNATNKSVTWSSSNPAVATVNSTGLVTGVSVGTATITVTTVDGNITATSTVTITPIIPGAVHWLESECGAVGSIFNEVADANASGGTYVTVQAGNNSTASASNNSDDQLIYTFNVSESGSYALWARVITPNANDDSYWIQMDDGAWFTWNSIGPFSAWAWAQTNTYSLTAGTHTLKIAYREDGALLDKLYITKNGDTPTGAGLAASNCVNNDQDNDGVITSEDCDDNNPNIGAAAIWYADADGDGLGDANDSQESCTQPTGYVATAGDVCPNDSDKTTPGACGCGIVDVDVDNDGICDDIDNDLDNDGVITSEDCDDNNPNIGAAAIWYADADGDGLGDANDSQESCTQPTGYVATAGDVCPNDSDKTTPGACGCGIVDVDVDNDGICDDIDNDLDNDGVITSEDCDDNNPNIGAAAIWYADADGDGLGDANDSQESCTQPTGYVATAGDVCPNDGNKTTPGACGCGNPEGSCGTTTVWLESECGDVGSIFNEVADANASGGSYVTVQSGNNSLSNASTNSADQLIYTFTVSESGSYALWARVITPNPNDDSFWIQMDGGAWFMWNNIGPFSAWAWAQANSYSLTAGTHTLKIAYREDGALLDKLYITKNGDTPTGAGLAASNCVNNDQDNDGVITSEDCDDNDPNIGAAATWYADVDGDSSGDANDTQESCTQPTGYVATAGDDCPADANKTAPGACGCGEVDVDVDNDGICDTEDDDLDNDGVVTSEDCDDNDPNVGAATVWYADADGDGSGDANDTQESCTQPTGYVATAGDDCPSDANKTASGACGCGVAEGTCGTTLVWLESECGTVGSLFNEVADANASEGSYVTVQSGNNSTGSAPTSSAGQITYTFSLSESGTYALWARVITPNPNDDSYWVQMDGGSWMMWNDIGPHNSWSWTQANSYSLSAGNHTLTIAYREDGALLDKLYLTNGGDTPTGTGQTASNCVDNDLDDDGVITSEDCDDNDPNVGAATVWYADADGDGSGDANDTQESCTQPAGYVAASGDQCPNDANKTTPGNCGCGVAEGTCGSNIAVRATGTDGTETLELEIDGTVVTTWTMSTSYEDYTYTGPSSGVFRLNFTNDGEGKDIILDYIEVSGTIYQAEDQAINTTTYDGTCGGGSFSETMHCNGYIQFNVGGVCADTDGDGVDDCTDNCPNDPNKVNPGNCGCGVAEGCGELQFAIPGGNQGIAACKAKFVGNITKNSIPSNFGTYWNQVTSENGGKWGSVERSRDNYNWGGTDVAYNYCQQNNLPFKQHVFIWGSQQPGWLSSLSASDQRAEVEEWYSLFAQRYPNTAIIDVVNESLPGHAPTVAVKNALGGANNGASIPYLQQHPEYGPYGTGWDYIIYAFAKAREYFPNAVLVLNDYGIISSSSAINQHLEIVNILKDRGLIDAVGIQAHAFSVDNMSASQITNGLNQLDNAGLPIHVTELDIRGSGGSESSQRDRYAQIFPAFYEHPAVAGITLWGYTEGQTWMNNSGILNSNGSERLAMQWLKSYMASRPNVCGNQRNALLIESENLVQVYPNPFGEEGIEIVSHGESEYSIHDLYGNILESGSFNDSTRVGFDLNSGTYFITIQTNGNTEILKVVKL